MKKQVQITALFLTALLLGGCGATNSPSESAQSNPEYSEPEGSASASAKDTENLLNDWLPQGVKQVMAETEPLPELARAIVEEYEIPEEEWANTKYYYNYVDLNDDGTDEIFAVVIGPYTSGTGGDSGMWLIPYAGMAVSQTFTLIRTPIIISDTMTGGAHDLIFQRSGGGGETEYVRLTCSDGTYSNPSDAEVVEDISKVEGTAILCNDVAADMESGNYLTLEDAKG
ncbi:hypothetical protein [Oscillibacter ruminantium]|nr:hypothetical protein [Oscillibacter valericigenes]